MQQGKKGKKIFQVWSILMAVVFSALLFAACGETATPAATSAPAATTSAAAAGTTAMAMTSAAAGTTAMAAGTTAMVATTSATGATTAAVAGGSGQTIRIYSSLPDTGSSKTQTDTLINAMKLAIEQQAPGGMVAGFKIDYVPLDDATAAAGKWDAGQEATNANKAANDPDAMVYIGTFNSGAAKVSIPIMNKAGILMISPSNTAIGLTHAAAGVTAPGEPDSYYPSGVRNYFRIVPADDFQGPADANFMVTNLKAKNVYVVDDGEDYGTGLAKAFEQSVTKQGAKVLAHDSITGKESDYKSLANKIKAAQPDGIFFGGISQQQGGKLLADIRAAGVKVPFLGGDGINDDAFLKDSGSAGEGAYSSVGGINPVALPQKGQDFLKAYKAKYGDTIQAYTAYGYECMSVALYAIKQAGKKDRPAIIQAVAGIKDFDGVLGKFSFNKNGDTTQTTHSFYIAKGGQWVYDSSADAAAS